MANTSEEILAELRRNLAAKSSTTTTTTTNRSSAWIPVSNWNMAPSVRAANAKKPAGPEPKPAATTLTVTRKASTTPAAQRERAEPIQSVRRTTTTAAPDSGIQTVAARAGAFSPRQEPDMETVRAARQPRPAVQQAPRPYTLAEFQARGVQKSGIAIPETGDVWAEMVRNVRDAGLFQKPRTILPDLPGGEVIESGKYAGFPRYGNMNQATPGLNGWQPPNDDGLRAAAEKLRGLDPLLDRQVELARRRQGTAGMIAQQAEVHPELWRRQLSEEADAKQGYRGWDAFRELGGDALDWWWLNDQWWKGAKVNDLLNVLGPLPPAQMARQMVTRGGNALLSAAGAPAGSEFGDLSTGQAASVISGPLGAFVNPWSETGIWTPARFAITAAPTGGASAIAAPFQSLFKNYSLSGNEAVQFLENTRRMENAPPEVRNYARLGMIAVGPAMSAQTQADVITDAEDKLRTPEIRAEAEQRLQQSRALQQQSVTALAAGDAARAEQLRTQAGQMAMSASAMFQRANELDAKTWDDIVYSRQDWLGEAGWGVLADPTTFIDPVGDAIGTGVRKILGHLYRGTKGNVPIEELAKAVQEGYQIAGALEAGLDVTRLSKRGNVLAPNWDVFKASPVDAIGNWFRHLVERTPESEAHRTASDLLGVMSRVFNGVDNVADAQRILDTLLTEPQKLVTGLDGLTGNYFKQSGGVLRVGEDVLLNPEVARRLPVLQVAADALRKATALADPKQTLDVPKLWAEFDSALYRSTRRVLGASAIDDLPIGATSMQVLKVAPKAFNAGASVKLADGSFGTVVSVDEAAQTVTVAGLRGEDTIRPGSQAIWRNGDVDTPITITGVAGKADGQWYYTIEGSKTGIPESQIMVDPAMRMGKQMTVPISQATAVQVATGADARRVVTGDLVSTPQGPGIVEDVKFGPGGKTVTVRHGDQVMPHPDTEVQVYKPVKAQGERAVILFKDKDGKDLATTTLMSPQEAKLYEKHLTAAIKAGFGDKMMKAIDGLTAVQRGFLSDMWLNLRPGHWIRNATSATAAMMADGIYSIETVPQIIDDFAKFFPGSFPTERIMKAFTNTDNSKHWTRAQLRWESKNPYAAANEALSEVWTGMTSILGRVPFGEQAFYTRAFHKAFMRGIAEEWTGTVGRTLDVWLREFGAPVALRKDVVAAIAATGARGGKDAIRTKLSEMLASKWKDPNLRGMGIPAEVFSLDGELAMEDVLKEWQRTSRQADDPKLMEAMDAIIRAEMYGPAERLRVAPPQPTVGDWTFAEIAEDAAGLATRLGEYMTRSGMPADVAQAQAFAFAQEIAKKESDAWTSLVLNLQQTATPGAMNVSFDLMARVYEFKEAARRAVDTLSRAAADSGSDALWRVKWEQTQALYTKLSDDVQGLFAQAGVDLGRVLNGEEVPRRYRWDAAVQRYLDWDEQVFRDARAIELGGVDDTERELWQKVIDANRQFVDRQYVAMFEAFRKYPSVEALDVIRSTMKQTDIEGARAVAFLQPLRDELGAALARKARNFGVLRDEYRRIRNATWNGMFDNQASYVLGGTQAIIADGLGKRNVASLRWQPANIFEGHWIDDNTPTTYVLVGATERGTLAGYDLARNVMDDFAYPGGVRKAPVIPAELTEQLHEYRLNRILADDPNLPRNKPRVNPEKVTIKAISDKRGQKGWPGKPPRPTRNGRRLQTPPKPLTPEHIQWTDEQGVHWTMNFYDADRSVWYAVNDAGERRAFIEYESAGGMPAVPQDVYDNWLRITDQAQQQAAIDGEVDGIRQSAQAAPSTRVNGVQETPESVLGVNIPVAPVSPQIDAVLPLLRAGGEAPTIDGGQLQLADAWWADLPEELQERMQRGLPIEEPARPVPQAVPRVVREDFRRGIREAYNLGDEQADVVLALADARASVWAHQTGREAAEWYPAHIARVQSGGDAANPSMLAQAGVGAAKGSTEFLDDGRAILRGLTAPDVSTAVHELAHVFRRDLADVAKIDARAADDMRVLEAWARVRNGTWTVEAEEQFARGFERYLAEGVAPSPALQGAFGRFRQWLAQIYRSLQNIFPKNRMSPQVRGVFDRLLADMPDVSKMTPELQDLVNWGEEAGIRTNYMRKGDGAERTQVNHLINAVNKAAAEAGLLWKIPGVQSVDAWIKANPQEYRQAIALLRERAGRIWNETPTGERIVDLVAEFEQRRASLESLLEMYRQRMAEGLSFRPGALPNEEALYLRDLMRRAERVQGQLDAHNSSLTALMVRQEMGDDVAEEVGEVAQDVAQVAPVQAAGEPQLLNRRGQPLSVGDAVKIEIVDYQVKPVQGAGQIRYTIADTVPDRDGKILVRWEANGKSGERRLEYANLMPETTAQDVAQVAPQTALEAPRSVEAATAVPEAPVAQAGGVAAEIAPITESPRIGGEFALEDAVTTPQGSGSIVGINRKNGQLRSYDVQLESGETVELAAAEVRAADETLEEMEAALRAMPPVDRSTFPDAVHTDAMSAAYTDALDAWDGKTSLNQAIWNAYLQRMLRQKQAPKRSMGKLLDEMQELGLIDERGMPLRDVPTRSAAPEAPPAPTPQGVQPARIDATAPSGGVVPEMGVAPRVAPETQGAARVPDVAPENVVPAAAQAAKAGTEPEQLTIEIGDLVDYDGKVYRIDADDDGNVTLRDISIRDQRPMVGMTTQRIEKITGRKLGAQWPTTSPREPQRYPAQAAKAGTVPARSEPWKPVNLAQDTYEKYVALGADQDTLQVLDTFADRPNGLVYKANVQKLLAQATDRMGAQQVEDILYGRKVADASDYDEVIDNLTEPIDRAPESATIEAGGVDNGLSGAATGRIEEPNAGTLATVSPEDVRGVQKGGDAGARGARSGGDDARGVSAEPTGGDAGLPGVGSGEESVLLPAGRGTDAGPGDAGDGAVSGRRTNRRPANSRGLGNDRPADQQPQRTTLSTPTTTRHDYVITDADNLEDFGGAKTRYRTNVDAIRLLKKIEAEGRSATPEEQRILARFSGWGLSDFMQGPLRGYAPSRWDRDWPWEKEWNEIRELLTEDELKAAQAAGINSHFTSPTVVNGMYGILERLGLGNLPVIRMLEPAGGVGNMIGLMPTHLAARAQRTAVEMDSITGRILKQLYQNANVLNMPYQKTPLPSNYFNVAISNVPFANVAVSDPLFNGPKTRFLTESLHNYYFAKALDQVEPGGIVAFITSAYTMNAPTTRRVRQYLADRAELVGAVRLPNTAFKSNAGTEVVTDIIFLRKLAPGEAAKNVDWVNSRKVKIDGAPLDVNQYFIDNPDMVLGKQAATGTMYAAKSYNVEPTGDLAEQLTAIQAKFPENIIQPNDVAPDAVMDNPLSILRTRTAAKNNAYTVVDGKLQRRVGDRIITPKVDADGEARIRGMLEIRDSARNVIEVMARNGDDVELKAAQKTLGAQYDRFVKKYGQLNTRPNRAAIEGDPDGYFLQALEMTKDGKTFTKSDIFAKRVMQGYTPAAKADSASDALLLSLRERNRLDLPHMAKLTGKNEGVLVQELGDKVYKDPMGDWVTSEEYLSGNVRRKMQQAEEAARLDPSYERNVEALKKVQPPEIPPTDIAVRLGTGWIPAEVYQRFAREELGGEPTLRYIEANGQWVVENWGYYRNRGGGKYDTDRVNSADLFEDAMNSRRTQVYDKDADGASHLNKDATLAATVKQQEMNDRFAQWMWEDGDRADRMAKMYNDRFNTDRLRDFDGAHLTFPGMNPDLASKLYKHQRDGIWRGLQTNNIMLAYEVGTGKTYTMIGLGMEMKRTGLSKKNLYVVPKDIVPQWEADFRYAYPGANILTAGPEDFTPANRNRFMSRIATNDWDAIVVSYEQFAKLPPRPETVEWWMNSQMDELRDILEEVKTASGKSKTEKEIQKSIARLEAKLDKKMEALGRDDTIFWEDLGITGLFVDEADNFKNLYFPTRRTRVAGLPQTDSDRAFDMFLKVQELTKRNNGRGVVFATGTPIANSIAEAYTMMRYLDYEGLQGRGMQSFDAWANHFAEDITNLEMSPDGSGFRMKTRFSKFNNIPELSKEMQRTFDIKKAAEMDLVKPSLKGGKPIIVKSERTDDLGAYINELAERAERVRSGKVAPSTDNMLKITGDGRKASLHIKMMVPDAAEAADSKLNNAVANVVDVYRRTTKEKGTQIIWSDLGTPGDDKGEMDIYNAIKQRLVAQGIPAKEIGFVQDATTKAKKKELAAAMNRGDIRVVIASTQKMGAGWNVQERLYGMHHLDVPWRPRDVEQRNGRILRQGNKFKEVEVYYYVQEPFDAYTWNVQESKARAINSVMNKNPEYRSIQDTDEFTLTAAEIKALASGDPAILEKVAIEAKVAKLKSTYSSWQNQKIAWNRELAGLPNRIQQAKNTIEIARRADEWVKAQPMELRIGADVFAPDDKGSMTEMAKAFRGQLNGILKSAPPSDSRTLVGNLRGFDVYFVPRKLLQTIEPRLALVRGNDFDNAIVFGFNLTGDGNAKMDIFTDTLNQTNKHARTGEFWTDNLAQMETRLQEMQGKTFPAYERQAELDELTSRLAAIEKKLGQKGDEEAGMQAAPSAPQAAWTPPVKTPTSAQAKPTPAATEAVAPENATHWLTFSGNRVKGQRVPVRVVSEDDAMVVAVPLQAGPEYGPSWAIGQEYTFGKGENPALDFTIEQIEEIPEDVKLRAAKRPGLWGDDTLTMYGGLGMVPPIDWRTMFGARNLDDVKKRAQGIGKDIRAYWRKPKQEEMGDVALHQVRTLEDARKRIIDSLPDLAKPRDGRLPAGVQKELMDRVDRVLLPAHDNAVYGAMKSAQAAADGAMLNYQDRRGFDTLLGYVFPFSYYWTRGGMQWAKRLARKPALANMIYEAQRQVDLANERGDIPNRLKGTIFVRQGENGKYYLRNPMEYILPSYFFMPNRFDNPDQARGPAEKAWLQVQQMTPGFHPLPDIMMAAGMDAMYGVKPGEHGALADYTLRGFVPLAGIAMDARQAMTGDAATPWTGGDRFNQYRVRRSIGVQAEQQQFGEQDRMAAQYARQIALNLEQGKERYTDVPKEFQQRADEIYRDASKQAGKERLLSSATGWGLGNTAYYVPDAEMELQRQNQEYQEAGFSDANPAGSAEARRAVLEANPNIPLTWGNSVTEGERTPAQSAEQSRMYSDLEKNVYGPEAEEITKAITDALAAGKGDKEIGALVADIKAKYYDLGQEVRAKYPNQPPAGLGGPAAGSNPWEQAIDQLTDILNTSDLAYPEYPGDNATQAQKDEYYRLRNDYYSQKASLIAKRIDAAMYTSQMDPKASESDLILADMLRRVPVDTLEREFKKLKYASEAEVDWKRAADAREAEITNAMMTMFGDARMKEFEHYNSLTGEARSKYNDDKPYLAAMSVMTYHPDEYRRAIETFGEEAWLAWANRPVGEKGAYYDQYPDAFLVNAWIYGRYDDALGSDLQKLASSTGDVYDFGKDYEEAMRKFGDDIWKIVTDYSSSWSKKQKSAYIKAHQVITDFWDWWYGPKDTGDSYRSGYYRSNYSRYYKRYSRRSYGGYGGYSRSSYGGYSGGGGGYTPFVRMPEVWNRDMDKNLRRDYVRNPYEFAQVAGTGPFWMEAGEQLKPGRAPEIERWQPRRVWK